MIVRLDVDGTSLKYTTQTDSTGITNSNFTVSGIMIEPTEDLLAEGGGARRVLVRSGDDPDGGGRMNLGSDLAIDGKVRAEQATQTGECVVLGDDLKIPTEFIPDTGSSAGITKVEFDYTGRGFGELLMQYPVGAIVSITCAEDLDIGGIFTITGISGSNLTLRGRGRFSSAYDIGDKFWCSGMTTTRASYVSCSDVTPTGAHPELDSRTYHFVIYY